MRTSFLTLAAVLAATTLQAEPMTGKAAKKQLFTIKRTEVAVRDHPALTETDAAVLQQVGAQQAYYAAIAFSPDEGLASEATVAGTNFHDTAAAEAFALKACNALRKDGSAECAIAAVVLPKGWEERDLQLSVSATAMLRGDYRKGKGPKALAISPSTGQWAVETGDDAGDAALAACAQQAQTDDCTVVVAD